MKRAIEWYGVHKAAQGNGVHRSLKGLQQAKILVRL